MMYPHPKPDPDNNYPEVWGQANIISSRWLIGWSAESYQRVCIDYNFNMLKKF